MTSDFDLSADCLHLLRAGPIPFCDNELRLARPGNLPLRRASGATGEQVIGGLIVTHGGLAHELLKAAQTIEGNLQRIEAVPLEWSDSVEQAHDKIHAALTRIGTLDGVIIFTDMFGGTPSNISLSFLEKDRVEIVTGVNLPMIVKFGSMQDACGDLRDLAQVIRDRGSKSIKVASEVLGPRAAGSGSAG